MSDHQGFRKGKSITDAIHILTELLDKWYEHDIETHICTCHRFQTSI